MKKGAAALLLAGLMLLSACGGADAYGGVTDSLPGAEDAETLAAADPGDIFTERDFETEYDENAAAVIELLGDSAACTSDAVKISGSSITISDEGTYVLRGCLQGTIIVNADKTDKTQLVLDGVSIESADSAAIYALQADKVFVTTAEGTENSLANGGSFVNAEENNVDAVIFSKTDLTLNGSGTLTVTSPAGHGVVSKDSLKLTGGVYNISCAAHALDGKDEVSISDGSFLLSSGKDGIHAENDEDTGLGSVYIGGGSFDITAEGDGISAAGSLRIDGGVFGIVAGGGSENGEKVSSDSWGSFMGGGHGNMPGAAPGGMPGGMSPPSGGLSVPGETPPAAGFEADAEDESTSMKGVKADGSIVITSGEFVINSADDAVHSNVSVSISGGSFELATGDDGVHAEQTLTVTDGLINITESYEGLEALDVLITGGDICITASDDGINAAGGTDASGAGGRDGMFVGPMGGSSSSSDGSIVITGGTINVTATGDGLDANGCIEMSGGYVTVCGPTQGDTATLDYDSTALITGGTFIGTGASGMAQSFSDAAQGLIAVSVGNQAAGALIEVHDSAGELLLSYEPPLPYAVFIYSCPELVSGREYTLNVGSSSGSVTAQ